MQVLYLLKVNHLDDFASFFHIARQAVGRPRQQAVILASLEAHEHCVEHGSITRLLGRCTLDKNILGSDFYTYLVGEELALCLLVFQ